MDVSQLGTILGIWAHPDDETMLTGGVMAAAVANGQTVACVTATRGEAGTQDTHRWPPAALAATRTAELNDALQLLGVKYHHWLDYADGACSRIGDRDAITKLFPLLEKYRPDTILTFPPNGLTGHPDHQAVCRWACQAATQHPGRPQVYGVVVSEEAYQAHLQHWDEAMNVFFNLAHPELYPQADCHLVLQLSSEILNKKVQAIQAMPSQTTLMQQKLGVDFVREAFATECFIKLATTKQIE